MLSSGIDIKIDKSLHVLVVGGGGFIGSHVVKNLLINNNTVKSLDLFLPTTANKRIDWTVGSIQDEVLFANTAQNCDAVIYLAGGGLPASGNSNMAAEIDLHVRGVVKSAEICRDIGVKSFIFASSGGTVYGLNSNLPLVESSATKPLNAYGASKVAIENYLRILGNLHGLRTVSLRISNPYGEGQRAGRSQGFIATAIASAMNSTTLEIWGDGSVVRDFVHVDDVANAFCLACYYQGYSEIFNIGSGHGTSMLEIVEMISNETGSPIKIDFKSNRKVDVEKNILNVSRALKFLEWSPKISLEAGIRRTVNWYKNDFHQTL